MRTASEKSTSNFDCTRIDLAGDDGAVGGQRLGERQRAVAGKHADFENFFRLSHAHQHLEKCALDLAHQEICRGGFFFSLFEQPLVKFGCAVVWRSQYSSTPSGRTFTPTARRSFFCSIVEKTPFVE